MGTSPPFNEAGKPLAGGAQLSPLAPLILLAGDVLILLAFVIVGQRDHNLVDPVHPVLGVLARTAEFAGPWLIAGWLLGAFKGPGDHEGRPYVVSLLARSLNAWLVAAPLGILARAFDLGHVTVIRIFMVITLSLGGALLLGWRLAFALIWGRLARKK